MKMYSNQNGAIILSTHACLPQTNIYEPRNSCDEDATRAKAEHKEGGRRPRRATGKGV